MNNTVRNGLLWAVIIFLAVFIVQDYSGNGSLEQPKEMTYSEFLNNVDNGKITSIVVSGTDIYGKDKDQKKFIVVAPYNVDINKIVEKKVDVVIKPAGTSFLSILNILVVGGFIFAIVYGFRQMQGGSNKAMGFGKSRARLITDKNNKVTFGDVAGIDEAKAELEEIVDFLKDPKKFQRLGGKIPKGVLLVGPPGTGKTLLARAIAGEADVPFFSISGSDFVEMFVGVGASRVRDMFEQAKKNSPCIIFIDEIDAVGRQRGVGLGGGNDEREQTLNQLLVEMDGFEESQSVILVAATNRPDVLDKALLRPGRFDRQVTVSNPDVGGREKILQVHMKRVPLGQDVDVKIIARGTPGFSGADLANLVNEAVLMAARHNKLAVGMHEFEQAKDKVLMGAERKSMVMSEKERSLTAYHEAGHAIVGYYLEDSDPIHKATIIPRGRALGLVMRLPENDRISVTRSKLLADIKVAMGGRIAEELIFGADKVTTGASSDIKMATNIARRMVLEWGLSDAVGFQVLENAEEGYLGYGGSQSLALSEKTSQLADLEIKKIIDACYVEANQMLTSRLDQLHDLAKALLSFETLTGDEIATILAGGHLSSVSYVEDSKTRTSTAMPTTDDDESA